VRDRIITTYKDEIKMHGARERDFQHLESLINDLQRKTRLIEASLDDSQRDYEDKLNIQAKTINHHQGDIEVLKKNVHEKQHEGI
jgi:predicted RNase H-like nuclease (RuvC/YqgF family)